MLNFLNWPIKEYSCFQAIYIQILWNKGNDTCRLKSLQKNREKEKLIKQMMAEH